MLNYLRFMEHNHPPKNQKFHSNTNMFVINLDWKTPHANRTLKEHNQKGK